MIRLLQILGICAIASAGGIFALTVSLWCRDDPAISEIRDRPSAMKAFMERDGRSLDALTGNPPLVVQAKILASHLNPPKSQEEPAALMLTGAPSRPFPAIRPPVVSVNFKLRATSYCPNQPERSMALVSEIGSAEGSERWVKEGSQLGHFVIQEIRRGSIAYRDGDHVREMAVERATSLPSIVRNTGSGSHQASAAYSYTGMMSSVSADTNSLGMRGGD